MFFKKLNTLLFHNKYIKKLKYKKCKNCIYFGGPQYGNFWWCEKDIGVEPLKLICFNKKKGE